MYKIGSGILKHKKNVSLKTAVVFSFFMLLVCKSYSAELPQLSSNSLVSLVTCTPTSSYEGTFGHTALRIQDDSLRIDVAINFGMYNPDQSFFFFKVLLGTLESSLEGEAFYKFAERYREEGRGMREYYLDLTRSEKQQIWESLNKVLMSNDRFYKFNLTLSNCTTHARDVLFGQLGLNVPVYNEVYSGYTYRDAERLDPMQNAWFHLLFNLILGANSDLRNSAYQAAFTPEGLVLLLKAVSVNERSLVMAEHELFPPSTGKQAPVTVITILFFSILLLVSLSLSYIQYRKGKTFAAFDRILFLLSGSVGLFFLWVMLFTEVPVLKCNYNIAWALPTNIVLAFLIKSKSGQNKLAVWLARLACVCIICFVLLSFWFRQHIPAEVYLIAVTLLVRLCFYAIKKLKYKR